VKTGLAAPTVRAARADQAQDQGRRRLQARQQDEEYEARAGDRLVSAYALAGSEENARGHLVITAPTGGSAGVMPAVIYSLGEGGAKLPRRSSARRCSRRATVGYLCKHNATLAAAEGGCQAEIGVASAMGAAMIAQATRPAAGRRQRRRRRAGAPSRHDLRPGRRLRPVPCIERCAFGAVKSWTGYLIAKQRDPGQPPGRLRFDGHGHGAHRQGDELQVQGDVRRRPGRLPGSLLSAARLWPGGASVGPLSPRRGHRAWLITSVYYFYQYAMRSAPAVMVPQLSTPSG
jgi:hypothetical protein